MSFKLKPIESNLDHSRALARLQTILDAKRGSEEGNERDILAILIDSYEASTFMITHPGPIAAIKFRLDQLGLSRKALEPILGGQPKVSEIMSGKREITLQMARGLHSQLGIPADALLVLSPQKSESVPDFDFSRFPIAEMEKRGAFRTFSKAPRDENPRDLILKMIDLIGGQAAIPVGFRTSKSTRLNAKLDNYALMGWCFQVLVEAKKVKTPKFEKDSITPSFVSNLVKLSQYKDGPLRALKALSKIGICLVVVPHLKNTYLDGAAFVTEDGKAVIGLTIRYDKVDNFWFALLHELGHLKCGHLDGGSSDYLVDDLSLRGAKSDSPAEREADEFAETALLPGFSLESETFESSLDVVNYSREREIHPAIVAGRIQFLLNNYRLYAGLIGRGEIRKLFPGFENSSVP